MKPLLFKKLSEEGKRLVRDARGDNPNRKHDNKGILPPRPPRSKFPNENRDELNEGIYEGVNDIVKNKVSHADFSNLPPRYNLKKSALMTTPNYVKLVKQADSKAKKIFDTYNKNPSKYWKK